VLKVTLLTLWTANYEVYGIRKLWKALVRAGETVGGDQVARLMRELGIQGALRGRKIRTTPADEPASRPPDLVDRKFVASRPNELWVTDLERHKALSDRAVVRGHRLRVVAAAW
jgi:putative transposase